MVVTQRISCVVCERTLNREIAREPMYPIQMSYSDQPPETDQYADIVYHACDGCGCVQLQTLVDPAILYSASHNTTLHTPTWSRHHDTFASFVSSTCPRNWSIVEIGGQSGALATRLGYERYTILDVCNTPPSIPNITFVNANCETVFYDGYDVAILSHVFEHLFNPRECIKRFALAGVQKVYLSIPNMDLWLEQRVPSFLHVEHTYFCSLAFVDYIMSCYGYRNVRTESFESHSMFLEYQRDQTISTTPLYPMTRIRDFEHYLHARNTFFTPIHIQTPFFIFPAGHYGQLTYNRLKDQLKSFVCFLDNDTCKIGKRVYGTLGYTKHPSVIAEYKDCPITIVILSTVYLREIKEQLDKFHPSIQYISPKMLSDQL